jgi:hypothetical protein
MTDCEPEAKARRSRNIAEMREALIATGKPYLIENVRGAARDHELRDPIMLCGWTFGYEIFRERYFEAGNGLVLSEPVHREHVAPDGSRIKAGRSGRFGDKPGYSEPGRFMSAVGHGDLYREVMGVPEWMTADEVTECIPPYMAYHIARQALDGVVPEIPGRQPGPLAQALIWDARERHQDGTAGSRENEPADDLPGSRDAARDATGASDIIHRRCCDRDRLYRLVQDLLRVNPERGMHCNYCHVRMYGTAEELAMLRHRSGCVYQQAREFLAECETASLADGIPEQAA